MSRRPGPSAATVNPAAGRDLALPVADRVVLALAEGTTRARDVAYVVRCAERTARRVLAGELSWKYSGRGDWTLSPAGHRRARELTDPLRRSDPSLHLRDACRVLLGLPRLPAPEPKVKTVWTLSWRCARCRQSGQAADDGDPAVPRCPCCGSFELAFAPLPKQPS